MAATCAETPPVTAAASPGDGMATRKEKRKLLKKLKRKQIRQVVAIREREEEVARSNDPDEQLRARLQEQEDAEAAERERREFEERERLWIEAAAARRAEEEAAMARRAEEEAQGEKIQLSDELDGCEWEYVEEGPAEIIWQGNEIIVKKKRVRVGKKSADLDRDKEDDVRPTSNPLPPQSAAFASYKDGQSISAQDMLESVAQQVPNFGTEQVEIHLELHASEDSNSGPWMRMGTKFYYALSVVPILFLGLCIVMPAFLHVTNWIGVQITGSLVDEKRIKHIEINYHFAFCLFCWNTLLILHL